jgi:perosamine synthetase
VRFRHLAPAAAPLAVRDLWSGFRGLLSSQGAEARLTRELSKALAVEHIFFVSSGRAALSLILTALHRLSGRRRVILPAYTCFSVPAAVIHAELDVVLCDINPTTLDFDYEQLEALVADTTPLCVVVTHLFGFEADVQRVREMCGPRGVFVIDDAAQAFGTVTAAGPLGTLGDVGFYSFGRGKTVTSVRGGAIVTGSSAIAQEVEREYAALPMPSRWHGVSTLAEALVLLVLLRPSLYWLPASMPFLGLGETTYSPNFLVRRFSGVEAGLLIDWRRRLAEATAVRARRAGSLSQVIGINRSGERPCIRLPLLCESRQERDRLYEESQRRGLGFSLMYPTAVSAIPELHSHIDRRRFPHAERVAECLLTLPVHPLVSDDDCGVIQQVLSSARLAHEYR